MISRAVLIGTANVIGLQGPGFAGSVRTYILSFARKATEQLLCRFTVRVRRPTPHAMAIPAKIHFAVSLSLAAAVSGCGVTIPVLPATSSKSQFDGAAYSGVVVEVEKQTPGAELFRAFQQGATGFVPVSGVRGGVEELATKFCSRKGRVVRLVQETTSPNLPLPGNFPRVEWLFECVENTKKSPPAEPSPEGDRLSQLERLKRLLDNGTLTPKEFEEQKARILGGSSK